MQKCYEKLKGLVVIRGHPGYTSPTHATEMLQVLTLVIGTISLFAFLSNQEL